MSSTRREFLQTAGAAFAGSVVLPRWAYASTPPPAADVDREALADAALSAARRAGASYADIRVNRYRFESVSTRERQVQSVSRTDSFGFGVRVLWRGTWGFAASRVTTPAEARRVAQEAVEIARANSAHQRKRVTLAPVERAVAKWRSHFERDPFDVPLDDKIQFLMKLNEAALSVKGTSFVNSQLAFVNEQKFFASTDGSRIEQYLVRTNPTFSVTAIDRDSGDFQARNSLMGPQGRGYEFVTGRPWIEEAERAGQEAVMKLKAKPVAPGQYDLVLDPTHLFLTIHESVGHSTELDRALGWEADFAGTSFLTPDKTGKFRFASKIVNFVADRTQPGGLATTAYDDDGVPAQSWHLIKDGLFVDWQTTRDLAPLVGRKTSYGCSHADSWDSVPFPRMPNVSLEPAREDNKFEDVIADVRDGILIAGRGSYSIDQQRYNFQFGGQTFYEIKNGRVGAMLRDVAYQSRTPDFWQACDMLGGRSTYEMSGTFNDGKGQPSQSNAVSHGCPVARFRRINVLNTAAGGGR
jgi:TldD protein